MRKHLRAALGAAAVVGLASGAAFALAPEHDMDVAGTIVHNLRSGQGACSYCHVPHGAAAAGKRLAGTVTAVNASFGSLASSFCANCHLGQATYTAMPSPAPNGTTTMLSTTMQDARRNHPVAWTTPLGTVDTTRVGPYATATTGMECTSCHNPHTNEEATGGYAQFLRAATHNSAVTPVDFCSTCHLGRTDGTAAGDHPVNIVGSAAVQAGMTASGAFSRAEGDIGGGHLVAATYSTTNDGVDTVVTSGLVSCQTCHMPHAAAQGGSPFPLFAANGDGCAACHTSTPKGTYSENHPVGTDSGMVGFNNNNTTGLLVVQHTYTAAGGSTGQHTQSASVRWPNSTALPLYTINATTGNTVATAATAGGQVYCITCHVSAVHTTPADTAVTINTPFLREASNVICANCHGQNNAFYMAGAPTAAPGTDNVGNHATTVGTGDATAGWYLNPTTVATGSTWISGTAKTAVMNGLNLPCNACHAAHGTAGVGSLNDLTIGTTDTKSPTDRVLLLADNDTTGRESGFCISCHAPAGTHPTTAITNAAGTVSTNLKTTVTDMATGGTVAMATSKYPLATRTTTAMRYDGTGMYCQSCHRPHESKTNMGSFVLREGGTDSYETANGSAATPATAGATEPTTWSRDPGCGVSSNTTGCHNL